MFIIAMTGGIGSGKTTVSDMFKLKNISIIDTDIIAREILEQGKPAYQNTLHSFGEKILNKENDIDRKTLAKIIFDSKVKRLQLEDILHPIIWQEVNFQLNNINTAYCIIVVPLLIENLTKITAVSFNRILVIDTEEKLQVSRSQKRDNTEKQQIEKIMKSQTSRQSRLNAADDIILNTEDILTLNKKVEQLHEKYLTLSAPP